jgi:hypothetical protein
LTTALQCIKTYALAGFEPGILCSGGGRDDHYAAPEQFMFENTFQNSYFKIGIFGMKIGQHSKIHICIKIGIFGTKIYHRATLG